MISYRVGKTTPEYMVYLLFTPRCTLYCLLFAVTVLMLLIILIANIIAELNEKKNIAVEKAYKQVNKDFSSIFSTLLPGATAKLAPPDGASCLDGLEVKVGFGDVWKESLTELSGGQRLVTCYNSLKLE